MNQPAVIFGTTAAIIATVISIAVARQDVEPGSKKITLVITLSAVLAGVVLAVIGANS